jgi:DNA-binding MurR/RpiR family transcriptional regulator
MEWGRSDMISDDDGQRATDVEALITARFVSLSPRLQQAARFVVDNPGQIAMRSMRAMATAAKVDPSTMVRLAQELGFGGYAAMREQYRRKFLVDEGAWTGRAKRVRGRKEAIGAGPLVREFLEQNRQNLDGTLSQDTVAALERACAIVRASRSLYVVGLRSLFPVAFSFHYALRLFSGRTILLTGTGGTFADDLRLAGQEDALLVFSYRPYARDALTAVRFARSENLKVIAVTDSRLSPAARMADIAVVVSNASTSLLPTIVPFMAVAEILATLLVSGAGEEAMRQIERSEKQLGTFRVYEDDARPKRGGAAR